jgi:hypothetical protein
MPSMRKFVAACLLALLGTGCTATYVPISWGIGDKVKSLSRSDTTLLTLYNHYDPDRQTLRVSGTSFDEVMMPSEVEHHLGAYRADTKLIYRNLYRSFSDEALRDVMVHEFAHHIWFNFMSGKQREEWRTHLTANPTSLQEMVRRVYPRPSDYDTEDFAFTVEYARPVDINQLALMKIITEEERDIILKARFPERSAAKVQGSQQVSAVGSEVPKPLPQSGNKGINQEQ